MIRVAIIENSVHYLNALKECVKSEDAISVVYAGAKPENVSKRMKELAPDVVIIDIDSFEGECVREIATIKSVIPEVQMLVLTLSEQPDIILDVINAGASGCLLKSDDFQRIIDAIYSLTKGGSPLNERIARVVINHCVRRQGYAHMEEYDLTKREKEIMSLLLEGLSYKQISHTCHISLNTVFSHARKIYEKAHVHSRSELAAKTNNGKIT